MMFHKRFLELVCILALVGGFAGIAQAEDTATAGTDWFLTATKSAVSSGLDILAKTRILPIAEASCGTKPKERKYCPESRRVDDSKCYEKVPENFVCCFYCDTLF